MPTRHTQQRPPAQNPPRYKAKAEVRRASTAAVVARTILLMLLTLLIGLVVGFFVRPLVKFPTSQAPVPSLPHKTSVSEAELDSVMGSYKVGSTTREVTVRDAILEEGTLDAAKLEDGTYRMPSADTVLALARNELLIQEADHRGIEATQSDIDAYALEIVGTSDIAQVAGIMGLDETAARESLARSATIKKLRDEVVGHTVLTEPVPPEAAPEGAEDTMLPQYGEYVIELAGDEWDRAANMWADENGRFRSGLRDYTITNDGATYSAALAAYEIAYAAYSEEEAAVAAVWTTYVNELLTESSAELLTLTI